MTVYIVLMLLILISGALCFSHGNNRKAKRRFCNITIILFLLVQCLRGVEVGEDTVAYIQWFREYCGMHHIASLYHPTRDIELGYSLLNIILSRITSNERVLIIVVSFIIVLLHVKFIQNHVSNVFLGVMLFMGTNFFLTSMVSWRQFIAMGIVIWMYPAVVQKKYLKAILLLVSAFLFHDTSILFGAIILFAGLVSRFYKSGIIVVIASLLIIPILPFVINLILKILPAYKDYFSGMQLTGIGKLRTIYMVLDIILIITLAAFKKFRTKSFTILSILTACSFVCGVFALYIPYMFRIGYYFDYFLIVLIPELAEQSKYRKKITAGVTLCCIALFVYYLANNPGQTVPYRFCF